MWKGGKEAKEKAKKEWAEKLNMSPKTFNTVHSPEEFEQHKKNNKHCEDCDKYLCYSDGKFWYCPKCPYSL